MNEPQFVEAARRFAERILQEAGGPPRERIHWAFEQLTFRQPTPGELGELLATRVDLQKAYRANPDAARQLITIGDSAPDTTLPPAELATWTMMANLLFNLDEAITKE